MSLIESDSVYNFFQTQDLGIDFTSSIVPDSPNKFGQKKNNNTNNTNNNAFNNNYQQQQQQQQQQQHQHQQHQQQLQIQNKQSNIIYNSNNTNQPQQQQPQQQQVFINNNQNEELFSIFLQPEKENELNNDNNNNVNNNIIHNHQQHQHQQQQFNIYSNNGIVPNQDQMKKMEFINNEQMKQSHYNIVPESVFDVPFGISSQPMLNMQQAQAQQKQMNFKQPIQPNQALIPIPPNNLNNPAQVSILHQAQHQIPQPQLSNLNATTTPNNNNNNNNQNNKKKEEDKSIKKRKFISSTPVKGENGTTLIPTTDGSFNLDEERHMKRQRRLVKNREAAQLFRQRQKAYIQDLEKKVSDLTGTNSEFRARVELLNSENKLIREQLLYLRNFVTQAVSYSFPKGAPGSNSPTGAADQFLNSILPPGLNSPLPQGILPDGLNLQNPMIMSAIQAAASKNSNFRQNIQGNLLGTPIPSPQSSLSSGNNSPTKQNPNPSSPNNNNTNNNTNNTNNNTNNMNQPNNISPATSTTHQVPYLNTPPQASNNCSPNQR